jgi:hypothetical protein
LLLQFEHGHGDTFMMLRWVPLVRERVGEVRLRVRPELVPVLTGQWRDVDVVSWADDPGEFDRCALSFSLPHLLNLQRLEDVPSAPFLRSLSKFRTLLGNVRVGIRWAGDPAHGGDIDRSTRLPDWAPVLEVQGVTFYSLQLGDAAEQCRYEGTPVRDLAPELTDWSKTAAAMMELELIISVDTSCAHLAGALGRGARGC